MANGAKPICNLFKVAGEALALENSMRKILEGVVVGDKIKFGPGHFVIKAIGKTAILANVKAPKGQKLKVDSGYMLQINGGVFEVLDLGGSIKLKFLGLPLEEKDNKENDETKKGDVKK